MMHVMHLLGELDGVGGTARLLLSLVRHSAACGMEHSFVCMRRGTLQEEFEAAGARVKVVGSTKPWRMIDAALDFADEVFPDVIATHFTRPLACGAWVARARNLPLIHNEHAAAVPPGVRRSMQNRLGSLARGFALRKCAAIISNSHYTADTVAAEYGVDRYSFSVIHLPVEPRGAPPAEPLRVSSHVGTVWIGHIGGLIPLRRQDLLLRAVRLLRDRGLDARLLLVGDGPERGALERLSTALAIESSVTFAGYRSDLADFMKQVAIYVNPAVAEGFGIATVEAMLAGIPVVLANAGANPELVEHDVTGLLYAPDSADALAQQLRTLAINPVQRATLGLVGREHAARTFTPQRYAQAYAAVVQSACAARTHSLPAVAD